MNRQAYFHGDVHANEDKMAADHAIWLFESIQPLNNHCVSDRMKWDIGHC